MRAEYSEKKPAFGEGVLTYRKAPSPLFSWILSATPNGCVVFVGVCLSSACSLLLTALMTFLLRSQMCL